MGSKENTVSGGEKQRLVIKRAILKNKFVLSLNELDNQSEK